MKVLVLKFGVTFASLSCQDDSIGRSPISYREKDQDVVNTLVISILQHNVALSERDASLSSTTCFVDQTPQTKSTYKTMV